MKNKFSLLIVTVFILGLTGFVSGAVISDDLHLNIQTVNSTGGIVTGTFDFVFNISTSNDCNSIIYTNSTTKTTDTRGIISYYLPNVTLDYDQQYYLCYYRNGTLQDTTQIARTPYTFRARNITVSGLESDANLTLTGFNITADNGFFSFLGSLINRITKIFAIDLDVSNNVDIGGNLSVDSGTFFVDSNSNRTGIGTASPADTLTIVGTLNATNIQLASNCADDQILKWSGGVGTCGTDNLGGGNPFNQVLNTTSNVIFNRINLTGGWGNVTITESQVTDLSHTTDTNETARFNALATTDCVAGQLVIGVQSNGTVLCAVDADSGGTNIFDQTLNTTDDVIFNNINITNRTVNDLIPFPDSTFDLGTTLLRWFNIFADRLIATTGNFTNIYSNDWTNVTITESQVTDLSHTTDTNETARFNDLTSTDCPGGQLVIGIQDNGTVLCATDQDSGGGGNPFDQVLNTTSNVTFNNITVAQNISASWFLGSIDWTNVVNKFIESVSGNFLYMSGTQLNFNETHLNDTIGIYNDSMKSYVDANAGIDSWAGNFTDYSNTTTILGWNYYNLTDFDINDYYLESNPFGYFNSTNPQTETDPFWVANDSTVARTGDCPAGEFVQNTTTGGVECATAAGSGDITAVLTTGDEYLFNGSSSGEVTVRFNDTRLNLTIDARDSDTFVNADCPSGQFVQNISGGTTLECATAAGSGDITSVQGDSYITNGSSIGDVNLVFNDTKLNLTIDNRDTDTNETTRFNALALTDCGGTDKVTGIQNNGTVTCATDQTGGGAAKNTTGDLLYNDTTTIYFNRTQANIDLEVNGSDYWDGFDSVNVTQISNVGGVFTILASYLSDAFDSFFSGKTTDDLSQGSSNLYDNQSWNQTSIIGNLTPSGFFVGDGTFLTNVPASEVLWNANYSTFLTHIDWSQATNGTLLTLSEVLTFNYYNLTDFDINDYYLESNPFGYFNSTNPQTETDPIYAGENSTIARTGDCPSGQFVQNTTTGGVECATVSSSGDITSVQGDSYITNGSSTGDVNLVFNDTKLNLTIDNRDTDTNETTRFNALATTDCVAGQLVIGVQSNGTVTCAADQDSGGGSSVWNRSGTNVFLANTGDNVGIGTTSPADTLSVVGTVNATTFQCASGTCFSSTGLSDGGTIGFDWVDSEIANTLTITGGSVTSTVLTDGGTISFDWVDGEIDNALTISQSGAVDPDALNCDSTNDNLIDEACIGDVLDSSEIEDIYVFIAGDTMTGDLDMNANQFLIANGGGLRIDSGVDAYVIQVNADSNDGLFYDVSSNTLEWHEDGTERGYFDLDNGNMQMDGTLTVNGDIIMTEDDWIGLGSSIERLAFNGGSGRLEIFNSHLDLNNNDILGVDKLTVTTIDPIYIIDGISYATYVASMAGGVKEEVTGTIMLNSEYTINFKNLEVGSNLWLFYQATDFGSEMENLQIILTPSFDGRVWYEKNPGGNILTIHGTQEGEVSYRFTANRFDWTNWTNYAIGEDFGSYEKGEKFGSILKSK